MKICKHCILPETKPYIHFNKDGICNICSSSKNSVKKYHEGHIIRILDKIRGKYEYDCLVMLSGGKDSTASLYYAIKRYKLKVLALTFDNGFEDENALKNIKNAIEILNTDWLYIKKDYMHDMFREAILSDKKISLCSLCSLWYIRLTYSIAKKFNIPIIIGGWTKAQANSGNFEAITPDYRAFTEDLSDFIDLMKKKYAKYKHFPKSIARAIKQGKGWKNIKMLSPHWFLDSTEEEYSKLIKRELNWHPTPYSYPLFSTNCNLNHLSSYLAIKRIGFTHYHIELSNEIRDKRITRKEALRRVSIPPNKEIIEKILRRLNISKNII